MRNRKEENGHGVSEKQKQAAWKFVEYWTFQRGSEKGEDQQFWNSLLGEVLRLEDVKSHVQCQVPVHMGGRVFPRAAGEQAHVHCVIAGSHAKENGAPGDHALPAAGTDHWAARTKTIFDSNGREPRRLPPRRAGRVAFKLYAEMAEYAREAKGASHELFGN